MDICLGESLSYHYKQYTSPFSAQDIDALNKYNLSWTAMMSHIISNQELALKHYIVDQKGQYGFSNKITISSGHVTIHKTYHDNSLLMIYSISL